MVAMGNGYPVSVTAFSPALVDRLDGRTGAKEIRVPFQVVSMYKKMIMQRAEGLSDSNKKGLTKIFVSP